MNSVQTNGGIHTKGISFRSDITGFNWSEVPTTLIEMGFMTNPEEDRNLSNPHYLRNLMTKLAEGIVTYRGQARA
ncbi:N-acetylmuramoyl-L-alanine amidase [Pseudalkalibacillus hwajinpoensis]|uniref:N-acetylmuramoyl-L-alanine amidase n=1 Tax=Guptibacillus hwajinpoensis TaxID=208199 RepID=UPI003B8A9A30